MKASQFSDAEKRSFLGRGTLALQWLRSAGRPGSTRRRTSMEEEVRGHAAARDALAEEA
jgi:hypothetical protein